jgi:hypothetical protein
MFRSAKRWFAVCALLGGVALVWLIPAEAGAQTAPNYPVTTSPTTAVCPTCNTTAPPNGGTQTSASLAFTGGDIALVTVLGLVILGAGVGLVLLGRRRSGTAA